MKGPIHRALWPNNIFDPPSISPCQKRPNHVTVRDFSTAMAFAIIRSGGRQHRVAEGDVIDVDFLDEKSGKEGVFEMSFFIAMATILPMAARLSKGRLFRAKSSNSVKTRR
jgi:hypothetical protein